MTYRPPTSHGRVSQAARTRSQNKARPSQKPSQKVVEVPEEEDEDDDEEDERLRQEEDQRAELRTKKRGAREEADPSLPDSVPKRKKYAVRMEECFDVERMVDKLLEGHNDLLNLKDILASAPRLRGELKRRLSQSDLRGPSPTLPEEGEAVLLRTPLDSLEAHLDASQWRTSQLGADQSKPAQYEPAEDEPEAEPRGPDEPRTEGVITVGNDTPPPIPIPEQAPPYWPEGIPEPDTEHAAEPLDTEMPSSEELPPGLPHAEEGVNAGVPVRDAWGMQAERPPRETAEEKFARVQGDMRVDEAQETGDLGFSATRMEIERADRRIHEVAVTSFQRYSMLSDELPASRSEVEQLSAELAEERAENQAWRSRMEAKEAKWEKRLQDMAAIVERLSSTKVVDWIEQSQYGIHGKEVQGLFGQGGTTKPPQHRGMGKVLLDPTEASARRETEEGRFNFKTPMELASQQATPMTIEIPESEPAQGPQPPLAEGGPMKESPTILLEVQEGTLTGATAFAEPEVMEGGASRLDELVAAIELEMPSGGPQRQESPERVPEVGELRTQLGSWATGAGSGEHIS
ncbi:hypothetical protein CBR_g44272 [Chara braunii]|uniref:Uncharacterized protein n=1 Tax=Chara braunii TaxID=69332 RepID=A0A388K2X0_CHABU|nr:hypothetical protein CBR_g44272 [Chara braunii]|eukprot:GBG64388.1 hypothetical protein CBR_g44272 [Chara braunii]